MAVFKDKKIATQVLSGDIQYSRGSWKKTVLTVALSLSVCATLVLGTYVFIKHPGANLAPASREVQATQGAPATSIPANHEVARRETSDDRKAEIVTLQPEAVKETKKIAATLALAPALKIETKKTAPAPVAIARPTLFADAKLALRAGKTDAALDALKLNTAALRADAPEKTEAAILRGRAYLTAGRIDDARAEFEPLAFLPKSTEAGTDALMGNFWAQAGLMTRCRESELEQVREGAESWGAAMASLESARRAEEAAGGDLTKLEAARALYQAALDTGKLDEKSDDDCLAHLTKLTNDIVLNPKTPCSAPKAVFHKVDAGDTVEKIARKYKVNTGQIKSINKLNDKMVVRYGQVLKVLPGDVVYKVNRTTLTATLYIDDIFIHRYPVGIGPGNATPVGTYNIDTKVQNPDWWYDGKRVPFGDTNNILGTRWMGFASNEQMPQGAGLGVHGTAFPESVPGRESKGCVRMHNKDVEEIYDLMPQGGKVVIND